LVRGGGSQLDFQAYDSYLLARAVARFYIPIITGIGHEKNESVCDLMAKLKTKTPTKAAASIVAHNQIFQEKLFNFQKQMVLKTNEILVTQELIIHSLQNACIRKTKDLLNQEFRTLSTCMNATILSAEKRLQHEKINLLKQGFNLQCYAHNNLKEEQFKLKQFTQTLQHLDPRNILKRGYALVYHQNKIIKNPQGLPIGATIKTRFYTETIESMVTNPNTSADE
jgi:exodeoxyribonuclease VII large subunit